MVYVDRQNVVADEVNIDERRSLRQSLSLDQKSNLAHDRSVHPKSLPERPVKATVSAGSKHPTSLWTTLTILRDMPDALFMPEVKATDRQVKASVSRHLSQVTTL